MQRIFISYRRSDTEADAGRLYSDLRHEFGAENIFKDVDNVPLGADIQEFIERAIEQSFVVLVIIGPTWQTPRLHQRDDWVRLELEAARRLGKTIIPIRVRRASLPSADDLPESLSWLPFINAAEAEHQSWGRDLQPIFKMVRTLGDKAEAEQQQRDQQAEAKAKQQRDQQAKATAEAKAKQQRDQQAKATAEAKAKQQRRAAEVLRVSDDDPDADATDGRPAFEATIRRFAPLLAVASLAVGILVINALNDDGTDTVAGPQTASSTDTADDELPGTGEFVNMGRANWSAGYVHAQILHDLMEELGYDVSSPDEFEFAPDQGYEAIAGGKLDFWANSWYPGHLSWWDVETVDGSRIGDSLERLPGSVMPRWRSPGHAHHQVVGRRKRSHHPRSD